MATKKVKPLYYLGWDMQANDTSSVNWPNIWFSGAVPEKDIWYTLRIEKEPFCLKGITARITVTGEINVH